MRRSRQMIAAGALSSLAVLAFVVAPLLHAEAHLREQQQARLDRSEAFERIFDIVFSGTSAGRRGELRRALDHVLGEAGDGATHLHASGDTPHRHGGGSGAPQHSHGSGPHGAGSLQHFAAALQATPARPPLAQPSLLAFAVAEADTAVVVSRTALLVEQSQGPPRS